MVYHAGDALARAGQRRRCTDAIRSAAYRLGPRTLGPMTPCSASCNWRWRRRTTSRSTSLAAEFQRQFADSDLAGDVQPRPGTVAAWHARSSTRPPSLLKQAGDDPKTPSLADQYLLAATQQGQRRIRAGSDGAGAGAQVGPRTAPGRCPAARSFRLRGTGTTMRRPPQPLEAHLAADPQGIDSRPLPRTTGHLLCPHGKLEQARDGCSPLCKASSPPMSCGARPRSNWPKRCSPLETIPGPTELFQSLTSTGGAASRRGARACPDWAGAATRRASWSRRPRPFSSFWIAIHKSPGGRKRPSSAARSWSD